MSGDLSAIPNEVLKSVLTFSYINLPQARILLHSLVLGKSFWCVSASALSVTTCFLCSVAWQSWKGSPPKVMELFPITIFKAWPSLLMVIYSEMRKLCLSYVMHSKCGREWHSAGSERWAHKNTVTVAGSSGQMWLSSLAFQTQILKPLPTQVAPGACIILTFIFTGSSSVDGHCTPPSGLGQESDFCGPWRERTQFYVEETD